MHQLTTTYCIIFQIEICQIFHYTRCIMTKRITSLRGPSEDQLDDLELDRPITLRILNGIAWTSPKRNDGGDGRP